MASRRCGTTASVGRDDGPTLVPVRVLLAAFVVLAVALSACSSTDAEPEEALDAGPEDVVLRWLEALQDVDVATIEEVTIPANVALIAGAENGFTVEQMASVIEGGLPSGTGRSYWASFRESMRGFLGADLDDIAVAGVERFTVGTTSFAAVTVERDDATTEILAKLDQDGWHVDLVATVGPVLAVQIRRMVAALVDEADEPIARSYALEAVRSLSASLARSPSDRVLELEVEAIEDLPIDLGA
jgi:hypothetical protein